MAASLLSEMGITEAEIHARLQAVRFSQQDCQRIRGLQEVLERSADTATMQFIDYLKDSVEIQPLLKNGQLVEEIRRLKKAHILAMAAGEYGTEYVQQRIELGLIYSAIGLDVKWFLGAFHHLMRTIGLEILRSAKDEPAEAFQSFLTLKKIAFFDLALVVDTLIFQGSERTVRLQQEAIRELSTPVLPVRPGLLILPLIGLIDSTRAFQLTEHLLRAVRANRARVVVLDITGVAGLDSKVANHLLQTVEAARLMGATTIISGVSPEVAQTLVTLGVEVNRALTVGDLQRGLEEAERLMGYRMIMAAEPAPQAQA
jgi:rsbT co-antagonist protein RsbR